MQETPPREASDTTSSVQGPVSIHWKGFAEADRAFANRWDTFVARTEFGHLHQSYANALLRDRMGWEPTFLWTEAGGEITAGAMLVRKRLPMGFASVAAIPGGPLWLPGSLPSLPNLLKAVEQHCRQSGAVYCRLNIQCPLEKYREVAALLPDNRRETGHVWSYWNLPRAVMRLDISGTLEDVLSRMHPDTRNKSRRGARRGLRVRRGSQADATVLCGLLTAMGERKQVLVRDEQYFNGLFEAYRSERLALFLAEAEGKTVAAMFAVCLGAKVWEPYSAFDWSARKLYPTEALHAEVIHWAQQAGCTTYDMGGTCTNWPPSKNNKGYGVYAFKKRLGCQTILLAPYCDLIYRPVLYRAASIAENVGIPLFAEKGLDKFKVVWERLGTEISGFAGSLPPSGPVSDPE